MNATAFILARAGSKGVPGKNTRALADRPCLAWTIDHARASALVEAVVVSTDCPRAAAVALAMGAHVHDRPPALAHDTARVDQALWSALLHAQEQGWTSVDDQGHIALLYANVPVRPADLTDRALRLASDRAADSVISVSGVGKHHPYWTLRVAEDATLLPWQGDVLYHNVHRRQDLPPAFVPDGGVTVVRVGALRQAMQALGRGRPIGPHDFLGIDRRAVTTEPGEVIDIDSEVDALLADIMLRQSVGTTRCAEHPSPRVA